MAVHTRARRPKPIGSGRLWVLALFLQALVPCPSAAWTSTADQPSAWEWSGVSRVVAVGDLHGNHDKLVRLLTAADLIDRARHWSGGDDHLVVAGDFLDRGVDERPLMDLLRRLETESIAAGGRVHVLLGNHEVMNLFRDLRYVNPQSYRHFEPDERRAERRAAAWKFTRLRGGNWRAATFREFNQRFPPGYFGRLASLDPDGEYGSWLMELPAMVKINGVAYVHGGLNEEFAALGVDGINRRITDQLRRHLEAREVLEDAGVVSPVLATLEVLGAAEEIVESRRGGHGAARRRLAAEQLLAAAADPILGRQGPLWYRGNALQDERLERDILDGSLELLEAEALVVAHSPTSSNRITSRFHGRLFRIDHGIEGSGIPLALVAEQGEVLELDASTRQTTTPVRELPFGQLGVPRNGEISEEELRVFLSRSPVIESRPLGRGTTRPQLVVLQGDSEVRRGIFKTVESDNGTDRYQHEVAAYQLDRSLGLGMVPVTVMRTVDGRSGSLQVWVDGALDLEAAQGYNLEFFETKDRPTQLAIGRIFDALIGNAGRKPSDILGLVAGDKVLLIDHSKAFSTSTELPAELGRDLSIPAPFAATLEGLDREALAARLGKLISEEQLEALLDRRDKILASVGVAVQTSP